MRNIYVFIVFLAAALTFNLRGEEVKVSDIREPHVVTIDRRPKPNIVYSRCFGMFVGKGIDFLAATKTTENRNCPAPSTLTADYEITSGNNEKITTDKGETITETIDMTRANLEKTIEYKGRTYELRYSSKITVLQSVQPDNKLKPVDSFYFFYAKDVGNKKNKLLLACSNGTNLQTCLDTKFDAKKLTTEDTSHFTAHAASADSKVASSDDVSPATHTNGGTADASKDKKE